MLQQLCSSEGHVLASPVSINHLSLRASTGEEQEMFGRPLPHRRAVAITQQRH